MTISKTEAKPPKKTQKERNDTYYALHAERVKRARKLKYHEKTPAEKLELTWTRSANPPRPTPGSVNSQDPRRVSLYRATPLWSDLEECFRVYMAAAVMTELFKTQYVVDHTVPLNSHWVCGLHAHTNLSIIKASENSRKSNNFWPQMPNLSWEAFEFFNRDCPKQADPPVLRGNKGTFSPKKPETQAKPLQNTPKQWPSAISTAHAAPHSKNQTFGT